MALISIIVYGDITILYPTFASDGYTTSKITEMIAAAFAAIQNRLQERGQDPAYVLETSSVNFKRAHTAMTLCLIYTSLIVSQGDLWDVKAGDQRIIYESAITHVQYRLDEDEDDVADGDLTQGSIVEVSR